MDIAAVRLHNHHLIQSDFRNPEDVVSHFGAVQAQDYAAAKWSLGLRMRDTTDEAVENAFNEGKILRTHIMRPTWHFVMPQDIRWMQELTAPNVKKLMAHYNRKLELTDALFAKSNTAIAAALKKHSYLTRSEIKKVLADIGIQSDVQRLAHIVMWAELDQLICSGPRKGKQFSYSLLDTRAPKMKPVSRDEAIARLTLKYFVSHGPAQMKDFSWWSGLSAKDTKEGIAMVQSKLQKISLNNKTYYFSGPSNTKKRTLSEALLLSIYDEYTIAYKDRSDLGTEQYVKKFLAMGNALTAVMVLNGIITGTWKRELKKDSIIMRLRPLRTLTSAERNSFDNAVKRYGAFHQLPVSIGT